MTSTSTGHPAAPSDGSSEYVLVTGEAGAARLRLLHDVYGGSTEALLAQLGLAPGMCAADIGCGIGTAARWMAERVGRQGAVVGVDVSTAQLEVARREGRRLNLPQLSFHHADAYDIRLPRESLDLVYCRFVLCHLAQPQRALRQMRALLKANGLLVCDDVDVASILADPPSSAVDRMRELMLAVGRSRGVDYCLGLRLHRLYREVGFADPQVRIDQPVYTTGEAKRFWEYTVLEAAPAMIEAGLTTPDELKRLSRELAAVARDETIMVAQARKVQVWARK
jgi:ubiquinone/menaquinone biosynthesis C-methylase UbiE